MQSHQQYRSLATAWLVAILIMGAVLISTTLIFATPANAKPWYGCFASNRHSEWSPGYEKHIVTRIATRSNATTVYNVYKHEGYGYFGGAVSNEFYQYTSCYR